MTTTYTMSKTTFTIANIAGGDLRKFRLVNGRLSAAALQHARNIGFGGPEFGGPAGKEAFALWERAEEARIEGDA
jgi:hypothetical protein